MAPRRIHVAVLDTDIPCPSVYNKRGLYSSQFRILLQAAANRINQHADTTLQNGPLAVHVTAFDAVGGSLPPLEFLRASPRTSTEPANGPLGVIDAILITGSAASAYDPFPWIAELQSFIQTVYANYPLVKIFGSCFGHQIIAQALLSTPTNDTPITNTFNVQPAQTGFEMGIHPITLDPSFTAQFPPLARTSSKGPFRIQLIHGDQVLPTPQAVAAATSAGATSVPLPAPWMNIGSSAACPIQGLYVPGRILTYQGHFEFDTFVNSELSAEFGRRAGWSAARVAEYADQINVSRVPGQEDDDDDSKAAAEAVVLFFAGEDQGAKFEGVQVADGLMTPPLEEVSV
jgi:GMP synthase-like glutamine amidotransferase